MAAEHDGIEIAPYLWSRRLTAVRVFLAANGYAWRSEPILTTVVQQMVGITTRKVSAKSFATFLRRRVYLPRG